MHSFLSYEDYQLAYDGLHHVTSPLAYKNNVEVLSSRTSPGCEYGTSYHLGFNPEDLMEVFNSTFNTEEGGGYIRMDEEGKEKEEGGEEGVSFMDFIKTFKDIITQQQEDTSPLSPSPSFDWSIPSLNPSSLNLVTPPRNQGLCGSCYAFSSLGSLETNLGIVTDRPLRELSVEEVVDCSTNNLGCTGGNPLLAMEWVTKHGVGMESDYKYKSENRKGGDENTCDADGLTKREGLRAYVDKYAIVQPTVEGIKEALKFSTVAVGIDGTEVGLLAYRSGVYGDRIEERRGCEGKPLNHAVLITGWGTDRKGEYWRVRNSWGEQWGEKGFFRVRIVEGDGICGINKNPSVVLSSRYSFSPSGTLSTSSSLEASVGVQNICVIALGTMAVVSVILWCGCGEKEGNGMDGSGRNDYPKSPAFLYGAMDRRVGGGNKPKSSNIAKASPRWLGGGLGVYQNIDSTPPSHGGTPAMSRGMRAGSEDEERGLLEAKVRSSSFGQLDTSRGFPGGQAPEDLEIVENTTKHKKKKKKKKKKVNMGIGFVPGGMGGGKGLIDVNVSVDKSPPPPGT